MAKFSLMIGQQGVRLVLPGEVGYPVMGAGIRRESALLQLPRPVLYFTEKIMRILAPSISKVCVYL